MTCFWDGSVNAFLLQSGPMTPTLLEVAYIAGLPVVGTEPALFYTEVPKDRAKLMGVDISSNAWGRYIQSNMAATLGEDDVPTLGEHTSLGLHQ